MNHDLTADKPDSSTNIQGEKPKPRNVSSSLWERFQTISKKTDDVTRRSTEKRIQRLKKSLMDKVNDELKTSEEREILKKHSVVLEPSIVDKSSADKYLTTGKAAKERLESSETKEVVSGEEYSDVNKYMGVNDHLLKADWTRQYTKSGLEKQIDQAVTNGDVTKAEQMSDQLATRNYGVRISEAFQAQNYLKRKKEEEESIKAKKKKKLAWGFEQKHRWETKGNM